MVFYDNLACFILTLMVGSSSGTTMQEYMDSTMDIHTGIKMVSEPKSVQLLIVQNLLLKCNVVKDASSPVTDIVRVHSINIKKGRDVVASVIQGEHARIIDPDFSTAMVVGVKVGPGNTGHLYVKVPFPNRNHTGNFTCDAVVYTSKGDAPELSSTTWNVEFKRNTLPDLINHVWDLERELRSNDPDQDVDIKALNISQHNIIRKNFQQDAALKLTHAKDANQDTSIYHIKRKNSQQDTSIYNIQQKNSQQDTAIYRKTHTETGVVWCGHGDDWHTYVNIYGYKHKGVYKPVTFSRRYYRTPSVSVAIRGGAWYPQQGTWVNVWPVSVTHTGFKVRCSVYDDGGKLPKYNIRDVYITWTAVPV